MWNDINSFKIGNILYTTCRNNDSFTPLKKKNLGSGQYVTRYFHEIALKRRIQDKRNFIILTSEVWHAKHFNKTDNGIAREI